MLATPPSNPPFAPSGERIIRLSKRESFSLSDSPKTLEHLEPAERRAIEHARDALMAAIEAEFAAASPGKRRRWRVTHVMLYGSFARGDWFDDKITGRASDIDLLVIVNRKEFRASAKFWTAVRQRLLKDDEIRFIVSLIVHTHGEVSRALRESQFFFTEITTDGVPLFVLEEFAKDGASKYALPKPEKPSPQRAYEIARDYHARWKESADQRLETAKWQLGKGWLNIAAFELHQAAESAYRLVTLTAKHYMPGTHDLAILHSHAEKYDKTLADFWPKEGEAECKWFDLLNLAYTHARYEPDYETTEDILGWQVAKVAALIARADKAATERVKGWKDAAEKAE